MRDQLPIDERKLVRKGFGELGVDVPNPAAAVHHDQSEGFISELQESEERYRAVVEQASEGILLVDVGTKRILEANAAYQHLLGYTPEEILCLTLYDLVPYSRENMDCYVERVQEQGNYVSGERRHRRKDGSLVDVEVSANLISYGGRKAMCIVVRDITERKRAEVRPPQDKRRTGTTSSPPHSAVTSR